MQTIDQKVSEAKFRQELDAFKANENLHRKRGIFLINSSFPDALFLFTAPQLLPAPIVFAVRVNFNNYDLEAPSLRFINPFTLENLSLAPVPFLRSIIGENNTVSYQGLAQKDDTGLPFLCIPGIREYHNHPAHTGDSWLLHRMKGGEGTMGFILDKLYEYGIVSLSAFKMQIEMQSPRILMHIDQNLIPR
jgi:hypothetical protein